MTTPTDMFRNSVQSILSNIHTSLPGIVKSFDASTNQAIIQPALNKNYNSGPMPMPLLENVPVIFPRGGNFTMSFPIQEGDYVLLVFIERSIDLWKGVGGQVTPDDPRKFDLGDAVAIPGLMPFIGDFSENNGQDFLISFAGSQIRIQSDGSIQIKTSNKIAIGNQTTELLNIVSQILALLQSTIAVDVPSVPFIGPLAIAPQALTLQTQLDAIKGTITP